MHNILHRALLLVGACLLAAPSHAVVYSVSAGDSDGLVAALTAASDSAEADIIELERGFYLLEEAVAGGSNALPVLRGELRIIGNGAEIRRYSKADFRIMEVAAGAHVRLDRVVIAEGSLGAALNHGTLECRRCEFIDHTDRRSLAIIENYGELKLLDSDVSFNTLANAGRDAGTILNFGRADIRGSRLHANHLSRRFESLALASVLLNFGTATLDEVRISENVAGLEYSGFSTGSVVNLGNGKAQLSNLSESDNLPVASLP
jgi:hypothetical protein